MSAELTLRGLTKRYGDNTVLDAVGFDVTLAKYIAERLGLELVIMPMSFDACQTAVTALESRQEASIPLPDLARLSRRGYLPSPALRMPSALGRLPRCSRRSARHHRSPSPQSLPPFVRSSSSFAS